MTTDDLARLRAELTAANGWAILIARADLDPLLRIAEAWTSLARDVDAAPCKYPCLRDDLHDWATDNGVRLVPLATAKESP